MLYTRLQIIYILEAGWDFVSSSMTQAKKEATNCFL